MTFHLCSLTLHFEAHISEASWQPICHLFHLPILHTPSIKDLVLPVLADVVHRACSGLGSPLSVNGDRRWLECLPCRCAMLDYPYGQGGYPALSEHCHPLILHSTAPQGLEPAGRVFVPHTNSDASSVQLSVRGVRVP